MSNPIQHPALVVCVLNLLHLDDCRLLQHLDGIIAVVVFRLHKMDASEAACAQRALDREVFKRILSLGGALRASDLRGVVLRRIYDALYARGIGVLAGIRVSGGT